MIHVKSISYKDVINSVIIFVSDYICYPNSTDNNIIVSAAGLSLENLNMVCSATTLIH